MPPGWSPRWCTPPGSVTFTELAAATGLAKSTTSRLLDALERGGLIRRDGDGRFRPGEVFVRYAWQGGPEAGLIEVRPPVPGPARRGDRRDREPRRGPRGPGRADRPGGQQVPDRRHQLGRPLGAAALRRAGQGAARLRRGPAAAGRLDARTARTITSRAALDEDLREVRRRGYAVTDEELEPGLVAVAAPVLRDGAVVVAALSVSAPAGRLPRASIATVAAQCAEQAAALSAVLGHRPDAAPPQAHQTEPPDQPADHPPGPRLPARPLSAAQREGAA